MRRERARLVAPILGPAFFPTAPDVIFRRRLTPPVNVDPLDVERRTPPGITDALRLAGEGRPWSLPPWVYPPFDARGIAEPRVRTPQVIAAGASITVEWGLIPNGKIGVVDRMGISTTSFADTRITTRINANPVDPYPGIVGEIGSLAQPQKLPAPIIVPAGAVFDVLIENTGAAALSAIVVTLGWWY